jgi:PAS domain S-box-containing protein
MTDALVAQLRDPRLAPHLLSAAPAWLWSADGSRVLWSNVAGAAALGAATPAALLQRRFAPAYDPAGAIARLAASLPHSGSPRLERLRGLGGGVGRPLACTCSRLILADGAPAILIVAAEPVGRAMRLAERVRRLLDGCTEPIAVFSADGDLVGATTGAARHLVGRASLEAIGAQPLATAALRDGRATGDGTAGRLSIERLGQGADLVLAAIWAPQESGPAPSQSTGPAPGGAAEHAGRRQPLRFVWQMEPDGRFMLGDSAFAAAAGPRTAALLGRPWGEIAAELGLDPDGRVAAALASQETWSGIVVIWPMDATGGRVAVELSGLPLFGRDRSFRGYRGFGVCRDLTGSLPAHGAAPAPEPTSGQRPAGRAATPEARPLLTVVPAAKNVVPFRTAGGADKRPPLIPVDRPAQREISKPSGDGNGAPATRTPSLEPHGSSSPAAGPLATAEDRCATQEVMEPEPGDVAIPSAYAPWVERPEEEPDRQEGHALVDRLPLAVLVYRTGRLLRVNRALLDWTGWGDLAEIAAAGGFDALFPDNAQALNAPIMANAPEGTTLQLGLALRQGGTVPVEGRLFTLPFSGATTSALILVRPVAGTDAASVASTYDPAIGELTAIIATASDGVVTIERDGRIISLDRGAETLFGGKSQDLAGHPFIDLFASESHRAALDCLDGLSLGTAATSGGCEVMGRGGIGGRIPLHMTMGRIGQWPDRFCAVFRDITRWKRAEEDLIGAMRQAETASSAKSDFLAKISHEIRTPLNAIIGFAEMMMEERLGPLGNERYRDYLKDIHTSGNHLMSLINDLLDLSKIEAGKVDLVPATIDLNALAQQCVALMQPQANRERIIIRSSLSANLPLIVADARSVRQIVLNLLSNSIKFTGAGGQVIVSTALGDRGGAILRVRDTGVGMSEKEIAAALEPFRQLATSTRWGSGGTGLGLPLTKALVEANRASFTIKSAVSAGTLVEIVFPAAPAASQ